MKKTSPMPAIADCLRSADISEVSDLKETVITAMTASAFVNITALRAALGRHAADPDVRILDTVGSTNTAAKATAASDPRPLLLLARTQTEGRGRLGRSFHSPADTGLYMTVAYTTDLPLTEAVRVTAGAAVATVAAIEELTDKRPAIKWVNDLYLGEAKAGGILTESVTLPGGQTRMVVGIGLNLTTADFPAHLRAPAVSLFSPEEANRIDGGSPVSPDFLATLAGSITRHLLDLVENTPDGRFAGGLGGEACLSFYRHHLLWVGDTVTCTRGNQTFDGRILGVDEGYSLLLAAGDQTVTLSSGEVTVRKKEG